MKKLALAITSLVLFHVAHAQNPPGATIRAGMIGLDTSHVPAFAGIFNSAKATGDLAGIKIVAGYPGGTDLPASRDRVAKFTVAIIGCGIRGKQHAGELARLADCDIACVCDPDRERTAEVAAQVVAANRPAPKTFQDLRAIYDDKSVDAANSATTTSTRSTSAGGAWA